MDSIASFAQGSSWTGIFRWITQFFGISSTLTSILYNPFLWDSAKLLVVGFVVETGRRIFRWIIKRFRLGFSIKAEFHSGDPAYEWLVSFLTKENVWRKSRDFLVQAKSSRRKWTVEPTQADGGHVDFVPAYESLHLFRWKGYWLEIKGAQGGMAYNDDDDGVPGGSPYSSRRNPSLYLTLYTLNMGVLFAFVEECRMRYVNTSKSRVTIHSANPTMTFGEARWTGTKTKHRRPLESVILKEGVIDSLLADAHEFLDMEEWYIQAGIPHRRGYLLYGPPGTGKTTTVYAVAGELELEIYTLSLAAANIDDNYLTRAVSLLPPKGILLIEDIDCAFPSRDDDEDIGSFNPTYPGSGIPYHPFSSKRSQVTLSGLLNVLDGIGSEEGKIFFATTNHLDRLDPALLRPGRIDRKIEYKLASARQAHALFKRFFPTRKTFDTSKDGEDSDGKTGYDTPELADEFAQAVPEYEFSTAELQGYLLSWKLDPVEAVRGVSEWVAHEREEKQTRADREKSRREKAEAAKVRERVQVNQAVIAGIGNAIGQVQTPLHAATASTAASDSSKEGADGDSGVISPEPTSFVQIEGDGPP